jgi:CheY-like chemotaxis protein
VWDKAVVSVDSCISLTDHDVEVCGCLRDSTKKLDRSRLNETSGHGERVLYVDDEEPLVFLMTSVLERLGYEVTGCTEPEKALEMFRSGPQGFDAVVSDLSLPGMSGIDLAREFLQIRRGLPILITTGHILSEDDEEVRSLGLHDLIMKTDTVDELGQIVHSLFEKPKEHEGTEPSPGRQ